MSFPPILPSFETPFTEPMGRRKNTLKSPLMPPLPLLPLLLLLLTRTPFLTAQLFFQRSATCINDGAAFINEMSTPLFLEEVDFSPAQLCCCCCRR